METKPIVDWINKNKEDIRTTAIVMLIINMIVLGCSAITGNLLFIFIHIPNIIISNIFLAFPMVYVVKFAKELK